MATKKNQRYAEAIWIESRKRWQVNVQIDGQRKTFTSSTPGRKGKIEAEKKADQWEPPAKTEVKSKLSPNSRFWEAYELFLRDVKVRTGESNYHNTESLGRIWLKPRLEHRILSGITEQDWQECLNDANIKGRSKKMLQNIRGAISAFNHYCKKNRVVMAPTEDLDIARNAPVKEKVILQPQQLRTLFSSDATMEHGKEVSSFFIHAFRFCVLSGLRKGELLGLQRSDIQNGTVHIQRSINRFNTIGPTKTKKSDRTFRINKLMQKELDEQSAMLKTRGIISPWVFPDEDGEHMGPSIFYIRWCAYCAYHGFKVTLHELRHTLISIGGTGLTAEQLKPMVGHTHNMDTFGVYGHAIDGEQQAVADALDALFAKFLQSEQE